MDWEQLREKTLGEVGTALVTEGAGVAGGFVGAAFIGRQIQNMIKPDPLTGGFASITDAAMAWAGNNVPKLAIWYLTRGYAIEPGEAVTPTKEAISDARKAFAGSVVFDTLMRLANGGANPATASLYGWQVLGSGQSAEIQKSAQADVQRLIQENSALRTELNKALQRLATQPVAPPAPLAQPSIVYQQPVIHPAAPAPAPAPVVNVHPVAQAPAPAPVVNVQPQAPPPVVRYTPVTPYGHVPPYGTPIPPYSASQAQRPVVQVQQRPPVVRAEEIVAQPTPPAVQEREKRFAFMQPYPPPDVQQREKQYGFMQPPDVQARQKKFSFMAGEEKDIASAFGML